MNVAVPTRGISAEAIESLCRANAVIGLIITAAEAAGQIESVYSTDLTGNIRHAADLASDLIEVAIDELKNGSHYGAALAPGGHRHDGE